MSRKTLRRLGVALLVVLALAAVVARRALPRFLEARYLRIVGTRPYDRAAADVRELHESLTVADLHADALIWTRPLLEASGRGHLDVPRLIAGNVALEVFAVPTKVPRGRSQWGTPADGANLITLAAVVSWPPATWLRLTPRALYLAGVLRETAERSGGRLALIETRADLERALAARAGDRERTAALLAIEGLHALDGDLANLARLDRAGYRMMGLVHQFDNALGGSSYGVERGGLTAFGREVVAEMESRRILVDLAHASPRLFDDVLSIATRPVVVSHTGVTGTCDRRRNLTDDQLRSVAATGGVVGIGFWEGAVCGSGAPAVARAIRYASDLIGVDHVALGSDFDGDSMPFDASGMVQITAALVDAGFTPEEIGRISGGNVVRLLRAALPE